MKAPCTTLVTVGLALVAVQAPLIRLTMAPFPARSEIADGFAGQVSGDFSDQISLQAPSFMQVDDVVPF